MRSRSGTIQKILFVGVAIFLLLLVVWFFLDFKVFNKKTQVAFAQFNAKLVASRVDKQCKVDTSSRCFSNFFANFAKSNKFEKTKSVLDELIKIDKSVAFCHGVAHEISIAEVAKDPQNWLNIFSYVPGDECSAGFYHGTIEGKFQTDPNLMVDAGLVDKVCIDALVSKKSGRRCAHAFGHVIMVQKEGRVGESVKECQLVEEGIKSPCFQGVFMENIQRDSLSEHKIDLRANWDKKYVDKEKQSCELYGEREQIECWRSLAPAMIKSSNSDHIEMVSQCNEASLGLSKKACIREVLGRLLIDKLSGEEELDVDYCGVFKAKAEYAACLEDIINYAMLTSLEYKGQMEDYCFVVPPEARDNCLDIIKKYI